MPEKCEAVVGGNRCGFDAEWQITESGIFIDESMRDGIFLSCSKHIGTLMEENDIDRAEVEKL